MFTEFTQIENAKGKNRWKFYALILLAFWTFPLLINLIFKYLEISPSLTGITVFIVFFLLHFSIASKIIKSKFLIIFIVTIIASIICMEINYQITNPKINPSGYGLEGAKFTFFLYGLISISFWEIFYQLKQKSNFKRQILTIIFSILIISLMPIIYLSSKNKKNTTEIENKNTIQEVNLGHYSIKIPSNWKRISNERIKKYTTSDNDTIYINLGPTSPKYMEGFMTRDVKDSVFLVDKKNNDKLTFISLKKDFRPEMAEKSKHKSIILNSLKAFILIPKKSGIGVTELSIDEDKKHNIRKIDIYGENLKENNEIDLVNSFETLRKND